LYWIHDNKKPLFVKFASGYPTTSSKYFSLLIFRSQVHHQVKTELTALMIKILLCNLIQCQWEYLYESLYDCVSCPVYIVLILKLLHFECVSVRASVWKFVWLCVLSCIYCLGSYVISLWVCVSESICMKACMIVCLVLCILSWVLSYFIMSVCQWEHLHESLHDCVSCTVYIFLDLRLFHYGCVSVRASVWKVAWLCVLSCIYCHTSYEI
jgi:hypothetical protein